MSQSITIPTLILCAVLLIGIARHVSKLSAVPALHPFMALMLLSAAWTLLYTLNQLTTIIQLKFFWLHLQILASMFFAPAWFVLAVEYTGFGGHLTRRQMQVGLALILVIPVVAALFEIKGHYLNLYTISHEINLSSALPLYLADDGPLHWVYLIYTLSLAIMACLILVIDMVVQEIQWRNTFSLLSGILLPFLTNLIYSLGLFPTRDFDPTPLAFLLTGGLYLLAVTQFRLFKVVPIARDALIEHMGDPAIAVDMHNNLVDYNNAAKQAAGLSVKQVGKPISGLPEPWANCMQSLAQAESIQEISLEIDGGARCFEVKKSQIQDQRKRRLGYLYIFHDISERKLVEEILQLRLRLNEFATSHSLDELMTRALDEIGMITNSPIGFYHLVSPDQKTVLLQAWSTRALTEYCTIQGANQHYRIDEAGVWVDCVYQRQPVIHNDYASLAHRKGLPEGHAVLIRELVVPIIRDGLVVAILGLGNKASDYNQTDVDLVAYIAELVWVIVERKRAEEEILALQAQLREQAIRDPLTNLYNRRILGETIQRELARAERAGQALSFVVLDIDHFKKVNDHFGHAVGDQVLQILAKVLTSRAREGDFVYRSGGEEFLALLPDTPPELAWQAAERWRLEFSQAVALPLVDGVSITISCGVATYPHHGLDAETLLNAADKALYQAKGNGRNQTVALGKDLSPPGHTGVGVIWR